MVSDNVAALLRREATSQALQAQKEAQARAQLDVAQDGDEDRNMVDQGQIRGDEVGKEPAEDASLDHPSDENFHDMIRAASSRGIKLSESVVNQHFGTLEMEDDNEVKQGVAGHVHGEVSQKFGNARIGSGNTLCQGIY